MNVVSVPPSSVITPAVLLSLAQQLNNRAHDISRMNVCDTVYTVICFLESLFMMDADMEVCCKVLLQHQIIPGIKSSSLRMYVLIAKAFQTTSNAAFRFWCDIPYSKASRHNCDMIGCTLSLVAEAPFRESCISNMIFILDSTYSPAFPAATNSLAVNLYTPSNFNYCTVENDRCVIQSGLVLHIALRNLFGDVKFIFQIIGSI